MQRHLPFSTILLFSLLVMLAGCGDTTPTAANPTINSFTASPAGLPAGGGSVTLQWDVKGATTLSIDGGVGTVTGTSKAVSVTSNKTFTLTATNDAGSATRAVSVSVGAGTDTTPPAVATQEPDDGAIGVLDDQSIVISFSERMDQAATEAAYESEDLPATEVTFSWNADGNILTIQPNDLLEYAAGEDSSIAAKTYTFGFSDGAKDLAGNPLDPFRSSFSTLRVISAAIYATAGLDGECYGSTGCDLAREILPVGDLATAPTDSGYRSFVSFDLRTLPAGVVADEARLIIYKAFINFNSGDPTNPDPYPLGDMLLEHVNYGNSLTGEDYNTPVLVGLGIFDSASEPATGYLGRDVTSALNDDLANRTLRGNRSQYRLRFPLENNDNNASDYVAFTSGDGPEGQKPFLNVVYYLP